MVQEGMQITLSMDFLWKQWTFGRQYDQINQITEAFFQWDRYLVQTFDELFFFLYGKVV